MSTTNTASEVRPTNTAGAWTYAALACFVVLTALFGASGASDAPAAPAALTYAIALVGIAFHLALFPVVSALPSTDWARQRGMAGSSSTSSPTPWSSAVKR